MRTSRSIHNDNDLTLTDMANETSLHGEVLPSHDPSVAPFPRSRRTYVQGSRPDIRVPMREIALDETPALFGVEKNPPVTVYDTSGPYTDPELHLDLRQGLPEVRRTWIEERGDSEELEYVSSTYA